MLRDVTVQVSDGQAGQRLDRVVLAAVPTASRSGVAQAFGRGHVTAAGRLATKGDRAVAGSQIRVAELLERDDLRAQAVPGPLDVVHEDATLLAFNKPGNMDCHPVEPGETDTVVNAMLARWPELADIGGDPMMPALLHRIDAGTSGLVLAARTDAVFESVRAQFAAHAVEKVYWALVEGRVDAAGGVTSLLAHTPGDRGRMRVVTAQTVPRGERPMRAETFYRPLRAFVRHTLLEVTIRTGVTHQIRCQLASIGHPVYGDTTYGAAREFPEGVRRHFLHAASVALQHPTTGSRIMLEAPLATDMASWLERRTG